MKATNPVNMIMKVVADSSTTTSCTTSTTGAPAEEQRRRNAKEMEYYAPDSSEEDHDVVKSGFYGTCGLTSFLTTLSLVQNYPGKSDTFGLSSAHPASNMSNCSCCSYLASQTSTPHESINTTSQSENRSLRDYQDKQVEKDYDIRMRKKIMKMASITTSSSIPDQSKHRNPVFGNRLFFVVFLITVLQYLSGIMTVAGLSAQPSFFPTVPMFMTISFIGVKLLLSCPCNETCYIGALNDEIKEVITDVQIDYNSSTTETSVEVVSTQCAAAGISNQKDALLALKGGFMNGNEKLTNWNSATEPCTGDTSNWSKISCSNAGEVRKINFVKLSLTGTISPFIGCPTTLVSSLAVLAFDDNNLTGTIPTEIGKLTSLTDLNFTGNSLSGTIPTDIGKMKTLTYLNFEYNKLQGTIPSELMNLTRLTHLTFFCNNLSGAIPTELGKLTSLTYLDFTLNSLFGTIPTEMGKLTRLLDLLFTGNSLLGNIPTEIGNLAFLKELYFYDNNLTGTIPTEIGKLTSLTDLNFNDNENLEGIMPSEICALHDGSLKFLFHCYTQVTCYCCTYCG